MAKYNLLLKEAPVDLGNIPPKTFLIIVSDDVGGKKILSLDPNAIHQDQLVLRNTTTGLCFRPIGGVWQWVLD
jgi:hypothetical protein